MVTNAYVATHKVQRDDWGHIVPEYKAYEGDTPKMFTKIAPYLPLGELVPAMQEYLVCLPGKVMALGSDDYLVPAGYRLQIEEAYSESDVAAINNVTLYDATDVTEVVKNREGDTVTASETVIASMIQSGTGVTGATGTTAYSISPPVGVCWYPIWRNSDNLTNPSGRTSTVPVSSPTDDRLHNFKLQDRVTILCDYVLEYPVITEATEDAGTPFADMAAFNTVNGSAVAGRLVTFNARSNLVLANHSTVAWADVVGQILVNDTRWPKALLDRVKSRYESGFSASMSAVDQMPGTATAGLPDKITYAGGSAALGTVYVNLIRF